MDLREYFETTGISQRFFAKKTGISSHTLSKILNKNIMPTIKTAWTIEKFTDRKVTLYDWTKLLDNSVDD